jgi:ABC-2 type transport system permease protein
MSASVFSRALRGGWTAIALAGALLGAFLLFAMSTYRNLDLAVYTEMPEEIRHLAGFGDGADAAGLAYGAVYSFMGALTLAGIAVAKGSSAIAGEEQGGTMGLLLANPTSRSRVLVSKAASIVVLVGFGALILWGAGELTPRLINLDASGNEVGALAFHMFANALFYGFLALMIGGWTGSGTAAWGGSAAVMAVSYFAAGLLPLVEGLEDFARLFPWHYYNGSEPLANGVDWIHIGVLLGGSALFAAIALVGFNRRDLTERSAGVSLTDRLRRQRLTQRVVERLEGSARVSRISVKTISEYQALLMVTGLIVLLFGVMMGPFFLLVEDELAGLLEDYPDAILAMVGNADFATPEGWYQAENFGLTLPIAFIVVGTVLGSRALAGEEQRRTMGLLLANPIRRSRVVIEKAAAIVVYAVALGVLTFLGTALGSLVADLGMSMVNIAATSLLLTLLGLVFGATALTISAATGRVGTATYGTAALALAFFLLNSFLPLNDSLEGFARVSPFYYYLTSDPLVNGMHWGHGAALIALTAGLTALSTVLFERRDLRQG